MIDTCPLIGYSFRDGEIIKNTDEFLEYKTPFVGHVIMTKEACDDLYNGSYERFVIAGICKHRSIIGLEPILIDRHFINSGYKQENPPIEFDDKCSGLLKNLYLIGGKENIPIELRDGRDFTLAYCNSDDFKNVIDQVSRNNQITISRVNTMSRNMKMYMDVKLTSSGKQEALKHFPKMPMVGLVNQDISTRDIEIDKKINHAKKLFFREPTTMDNMRSSCETLSYVLEPLRENLKEYFSVKDVSDFFQIVNTFDIRHNKDVTKNLTEPEQLEWVFYTLLNTINTYTKIKNRKSTI